MDAYAKKLYSIITYGKMCRNDNNGCRNTEKIYH